MPHEQMNPANSAVDVGTVKTLLAAFIEALDEGQWGKLSEVASPNYRHNLEIGPGQVQSLSLAEFVQANIMFLQLHPDRQIEAENVAVEGEWVHFLCRVRGTNLNLTYKVRSRLEDGKLVEGWESH